MATFELGDAGDATDFTLSKEHESIGNPPAALIGPLLDRQFREGSEGFVDDLETAAAA